MLRILIAYLSITLFTCTYSQVDTEKFRKKNSETGFSGKVSLAAGLASGNSEFLKAKGGLRIDYSANNFDCFLVGSYAFEEANQAKVVNKGFVHFRNILMLSMLFSVEFWLQKEFNEFILLKDRSLIGAGLRTTLVDFFENSENSPIEAFWGTGLMFENEKYDIPDYQETNLIRSTNYLTLKWHIINTFSIIAINYFQFDVERLQDYRFVSDTSLNFEIVKHLVFTSSVTYRFDNEPVTSVKSVDFELSNGIIFSF